jgi:outer membrane protein
VRKTFLQLKDARERLGVTTASVGRLEENLGQTESRYRQQSATGTELLEARVLLSDARVRSISARAEVEIARASLNRAVGRLSNLLEDAGRHP